MEKFNAEHFEEQEDFNESFGEELSELKTEVTTTITRKTYPEVFSGKSHPLWEKPGTDYFKKIENEKKRGGEFSAEERRNRKEKIKVKSGTVELFRDEGMAFYVVKKGDTINGMRQKLSQIPEFSYLKNSYYAHPTSRPNSTRNISAFNILPRHLKVGMYVPVPLDVNQRRIDYKQFTNYSYKGICEMKNDSVYKTQVKELVKKYGERKLIEIMIAFARSETTGSMKQAIGECSFQRYEGDYGHHEYSFTMFHILMQGPGLRARRKLGLTEGQCLHPQNAAKLFLGYWLEKVCNSKGKYDTSKLAPYFKMKTTSDFKLAGKRYCGTSTYGTKLKKNFEYAHERLKNVKMPKGGAIVEEVVVVTPVTPVKPDTTKPVVTPVEPEVVDKVRYSFEELTAHLEKNKNPKRKVSISHDKLGNLIAEIDRKDPKTNVVKRFTVHIEDIALSQSVKLNDLAIRLSGDSMISGTVLELLESLNPEAAQNDFKLTKEQVLRVPGNLIAVPNRKLEDLVKIWYPERESDEAIRFIKQLNGIDPEEGIIRVGDVILIPGLRTSSSQEKQKQEIQKQEKVKEQYGEATFYRVEEGGTALQDALKNSHWELREELGRSILLSDNNIKKSATRIETYIQAVIDKKGKASIGDRVSVGVDKFGPYLRFQRGKHTSKKLRVK